jgi:predicted phosphoadenosine phosphosulfate sulfurtransferase
MAMLGTRHRWVRQPPPHAITDPGYFSFYAPGMSFENFVREFADWFSANRPAAILVGIRADESLNRFITISSRANSALPMINPGPPQRRGPRVVRLPYL